MGSHWPYERLHEAAFDRQQDSCGQGTGKLYTPAPPILLPRPPCSITPLCQLRNFHLNDCDIEKLELVFQPYSEQPKPIKRPKIMELLPEKPTANDPASNKWFWYNVGDEIEGLYFDYDPEVKNGSFIKPQLTLKTPTGKKFVDVPNDLKRRIDGPATRGELENKWMRLRFIEEKDIKGREHPAKIIKVEVFASQAEAGQPKPAQHRTIQAPQREPGDDSEEDPFEKHDKAVGQR
jgi:hypothetical protein